MNETESILNTVLKPHGFKKKGNTWSWHGDETVCEIKLDKDRWKPNQSYLGLAISVLPLNPSSPSEQLVWHLFGRGYSPRVEDKVELENCLNSSYETVGGRHRVELLAEICKERLVTFRAVSPYNNGTQEGL